MDFKEVLSQAMKKANISVPELSRRSGIPATTIYNYQKGAEPTIGKADKLLRALGTTLVLGRKEGDAM